MLETRLRAEVADSSPRILVPDLAVSDSISISVRLSVYVSIRMSVCFLVITFAGKKRVDDRPPVLLIGALPVRRGLRIDHRCFLPVLMDIRGFG